MKFHRRCGDRVTLLHDNTTAVRNFVEFNHGLILSAEPLPDDVIFEVCIDRKVNVWNGSLEIGVTTNDPEYMELPATATKLRNTAWIMSGCSIVKDGVTLINEYGPELDSLHEGEILGVMKSSKGDLLFYVNGRCLGVAAEDIPERVFAVIDLYGQCVQVTIVSPNYRRLQDPSMESLSEDLAIIDDSMIDLTLPSTSQAPPPGFRQDLHLPLPDLESGCSLESGEAPLLNSDWPEGEQNRANSESSGSGDPDQDVMSDREDEDSREDRYDSIARGVRDPHLDSNLTAVRNREPSAGGRCRVGMLYDWHLDQLTPYTGDANPASQYDNSLSEVSEAGLTSEESEAVVDEVRTGENRIVETIITMPDDDNDIVAQDRLRFHPRCGVLVKISSNYRTAERSRPLDDYNNGVVMTHRPLRDNELFEIRIDKLVDKWSGSIEMGVTHHNPATIRYPSTMTNMDSGTIMMSGCKVLLNGQGTCLEYGNMNLDELREGDRVGVVRKASGQLHYVINGADQGVAAESVQPPVWGVVDLYGMTVKVTIQDTLLNELSPDSNMVDRSLPVITPLEEEPDISGVNASGPCIDEESLLFHTLRDSHVTIINDGKTAHRPNAFEYFNNGVVTTNRTLRSNELFQVRLDLVIPKWAGSVEIGVTQHSSGDLKFPYRVTNIKTGTWVLAGEDVIQNGTVIIPKYVRNLSRLKEGDTVGVVRRDDGILHFYVNGADQGPAACNVPEHVFGIVDLYGRVAQVSMVDCHRPPLSTPFSPESPVSTESNATVYPEMCFHRVHGRNARLSRTRLTASRTAVYSEFNDAVLFSSRPLRECDMFELRIDAMVDCWIGSLEIGVTAIRPEDLETNGSIGSLAGTATDLNYDTYILSGAAMMKDGECVKSGYALDLDTLTVGSRVGPVKDPDFATFFLCGEVLMKNGHCFGTYPLNLSKLQVGNRIGMMWHADRYLHYYLDGMDMGKAWYVPHLNIHAVVDLYGQCTQVTILQNEERAFNYNGRSNSDSLISSNGIRTTVTPQPPYWSFSEYCGDNVSLSQELCVAKRLSADPGGALAFSSSHLAVGEIFEIKILQCQHNYAGNLRMGVTDVDILNAHVNRHMPPSANFLPHYTAYIDGRYIRYSKPGSREQELRVVVPSFEWLRAGDRVGFKKTAEGQVLVYINGDQLDTCFEGVPDKVYVVMELYGRTTKIQAVTKGPNVMAPLQPTVANDGYASNQDIESEAIRELLNINRDDQQDEELVWPSAVLTLAEPEEASETDEIMQPEASEGEDNEGNLVVPAPPDPVQEPVDEETPELPMVFPEIQNVRKRAFTFHSIHGRNIKLLGSETVACRSRSYDHGIAIISKPLRRGESITFRVDQLDRSFAGSLSVGVVPYLPVDPLPEKAIHLSHPAWVAEAEFVLRDNLSYRFWDCGHDLDTLEEGHAVSIFFDEQGHLWIDINRKDSLYSESKTLTAFGKTDEFSELYPLVDVYGRVTQVSAVIHSNYVKLAKYTKYRHTLYKPIVVDDIYNTADIRRLVRGFMTTKWPHCVYYTDMLEEFERYNKLKAIAIRVDLTEDQEYFLDAWKRSQSTQHLPSLSDDYSDTSLKPDSGSSEFEDLEADRLETDRLQADRLQANRAFIARMEYALDDQETEMTSPTDSEFLPELLQIRYELAQEDARTHEMEQNRLKANYLKQILSVNQEGETSAEAEVVSKEECEVLQLALKYWLTQLESYPEIRCAVACGQVKCFCHNCEPNNTDSSITGWVRIERIEGVGTASKRYWHLTRNGMGLGLVREAREEVTRRPNALVVQPDRDLPAFDMWQDDNNTYIVSLAVEIDTEGPPANDRALAVMLNVRPHVASSGSEVTSTP